MLHKQARPETDCVYIPSHHRKPGPRPLVNSKASKKCGKENSGEEEENSRSRAQSSSWYATDNKLCNTP